MNAPDDVIDEGMQYGHDSIITIELGLCGDQWDEIFPLLPHTFKIYVIKQLIINNCDYKALRNVNQFICQYEASIVGDLIVALLLNYNENNVLEVDRLILTYNFNINTIVIFWFEPKHIKAVEYLLTHGYIYQHFKRSYYEDDFIVGSIIIADIALLYDKNYLIKTFCRLLDYHVEKIDAKVLEKLIAFTIVGITANICNQLALAGRSDEMYKYMRQDIAQESFSLLLRNDQFKCCEQLLSLYEIDLEDDGLNHMAEIYSNNLILERWKLGERPYSNEHDRISDD